MSKLSQGQQLSRATCQLVGMAGQRSTETREPVWSRSINTTQGTLVILSHVPLLNPQRETALSLPSHTHLEVLEFSSESLKTRDVLWSHLHDVAAGSWSWLIGRQELSMQAWRSFTRSPCLASSPTPVLSQPTSFSLLGHTCVSGSSI